MNIKRYFHTKTPFRRIFSYHIIKLFVSHFSFALIPLFLLQYGASFAQIATHHLLYSLAGMVLPLLFPTFNVRRSFIIAAVMTIVNLVVFIHLGSTIDIYLAGILGGSNLFFYWASYNAIHFHYSDKERRAFTGALLFSVPPFLGIFVPALAGWTAQQYGFFAVFYIGIIGVLVSMPLIERIPDHIENLNMRQALESVKKIKWLLLIEGIWSSGAHTGIFIFSLLFIKEPLELGFFFSYLGIIAVLANLFLGKLSDKKKNKVAFLYPLTIVSALLTIALGFSITLFLWALVTGLLKFVSAITRSFQIAFVADSAHKPISGMIGREVLLNAGKALGLLIFIGSMVFFDGPYVAFIIVGIVFLGYPFLIALKKNSLNT